MQNRNLIKALKSQLTIHDVTIIPYQLYRTNEHGIIYAVTITEFMNICIYKFTWYAKKNYSKNKLNLHLNILFLFFILMLLIPEELNFFGTVHKFYSSILQKFQLSLRD